MESLKNLLSSYIGKNKNYSFAEDSFNLNNTTYQRLGESLINIATILDEYPNDKIYLASIKILLNTAFVAIKLNNNRITIASCAREGLIKQNSAVKAISKIKKQLCEK